MKHIVLYLLCAVGTQSLCCADATKIPRTIARSCRDFSRFHEVHSTGDLPPAIATLCGDKLADPGHNWNATDAILDPTLPAKRLIWAAIGGDYYVVHYERGGIAHVSRVGCETEKGRTETEIGWNGVGGTWDFSTHCELVDWMIASIARIEQTSSRFASLPHRILQRYTRSWR